ncbi:MAG: DNA-processing protein DprA [Balneolaceae bacterium]
MTKIQTKPHHKEYLALSMVHGLGPRRTACLLDHFSTPRSVLEAPLPELEAVKGISEKMARFIVDFDRWDDVDRVFRVAKERGIDWMTPADEIFPDPLLQIYDTPPILWSIGDPSILKRPMVAVVGTRRAATYSTDLAREWSMKLAQAGFVVVSGMASGVDHAAHQGALSAGETVAVLGNGVDRIYPRESTDVYKAMTSGGGVLLSPFLPGSRPVRGNFPARNRLISGLSLGLLLVQSGMKGGSMRTARMALDQNREVFAIPHDLHRAFSEGGHYLIKSGEAKLVGSLEDVISELPPMEQPDGPNLEAVEVALQSRLQLLSEVENSILALVDDEKLHVDQISRTLDLPMHRLSAHLTGLEIQGLIRQFPGGHIKRLYV